MFNDMARARQLEGPLRLARFKQLEATNQYLVGLIEAGFPVLVSQFQQILSGNFTL